jgi:hypothetical protein
MTDQNTDHAVDRDGIDRRGFLSCMAWAGTAVVWSSKGGLTASRTLADALRDRRSLVDADFTFVQVSDSHIGFDHAPNRDVVHTYEQAIARINALSPRPAFVVHTGDHVHLSTPGEFDTVRQLTRTIRTDRVFHVPGEHDVFVDQGKRYRQFFGAGTKGSGYFSFDYHGMHFLGLANVQASEAESAAAGKNGLGVLGAEQLSFVRRDLARVHSDTPVVIFGHVPLLAVYPEWGWATKDSAQVLAQLRRFASVTVLNGHIHQILEKREGNVLMHTADSTAFPQRAPGHIAPGAYPVPAGRLESLLGIRTVDVLRGTGALAIKDETLAS